MLNLAYNYGQQLAFLDSGYLSRDAFIKQAESASMPAESISENVGKLHETELHKHPAMDSSLLARLKNLFNEGHHTAMGANEMRGSSSDISDGFLPPRPSDVTHERYSQKSPDEFQVTRIYQNPAEKETKVISIGKHELNVKPEHLDANSSILDDWWWNFRWSFGRRYWPFYFS
jgi:hypothetical protein